MNKVAIVYWSGTGNTEKMASCIAEGVKEAGGEAVMLAPGEFSAASFSRLWRCGLRLPRHGKRSVGRSGLRADV